jgi:predicted nucleotide-binding protein
LAGSIANGLRKLGHKITIDQDVMAIGGKKWRDVMDRGMEECNALVVLVTPNSLGRPWIMTEIGAAHALNKQIIPVIFDGVQEIPDYFQDITVLSAVSDKPAPVVKQIDQALVGLDYRSVFIVHGQNEAKKLELKGLLTDLGLRPVILHEQGNMGNTIIEKFEHYAPQSAFAFVLMTPDDKAGAANATEAKWRARQNVIMELGWFMAKLGRKRVVILYQGELEIPSDILGVVYLRFNESVREVSEDIRNELRNAGLLK